MAGKCGTSTATPECDVLLVNNPRFASRRPSIPSDPCPSAESAIPRRLEAVLQLRSPHGRATRIGLRDQILRARSRTNRDWADTMIDCLLDIKKAVALAKPTKDHLTKARIRDFEARYQSILDDGYAANPLSASPAPAGKKRGRRKKTKPRNLLERLDQHRQEVLAFMYDFSVPFDNNLAERDIRMMKVQQKISGLFRSEAGAKAFCRIRSYISTARKNAMGALDAIARVFTGDPFVPSLNTS